MSMYAYKDAARTQDISAKEAQVQDKGTRFIVLIHCAMLIYTLPIWMV